MLLRDVGINYSSLADKFWNVSDLKTARDNLLVHASDGNFKYFYNALMPPINMTDYED